jgi:hypothetical protein
VRPNARLTWTVHSTEHNALFTGRGLKGNATWDTEMQSRALQYGRAR